MSSDSSLPVLLVKSILFRILLNGSMIFNGVRPIVNFMWWAKSSQLLMVSNSSSLITKRNSKRFSTPKKHTKNHYLVNGTLNLTASKRWSSLNQLDKIRSLSLSKTSLLSKSVSNSLSLQCSTLPNHSKIARLLLHLFSCCRLVPIPSLISKDSLQTWTWLRNQKDFIRSWTRTQSSSYD